MFGAAKLQSLLIQSSESFRAPVFIYGSDADAYNLGMLHNFQQVFGSNSLLWLVPIFTR